MSLPLRVLLFSLIALGGWASSGLAAEPELRFETEEHRLKVFASEQKIFDYVFRDEQLPRPYFAHVKTLSGKQVSRNYPPREGVDKLDHADMHPGIWLSFGDLNGHDYWRLKARTQHVRFIDPPRVLDGAGQFTVLNHYLATDSEEIVCTQKCEVHVRLNPTGYTLEIASVFEPVGNDLRFGDQEEMGLGIRVATALAVDSKRGGTILDSEGRINGEQIWGKSARWCDYSGSIEGAWVGLSVLTSPKNFRASWSHARDYGFLAMNPFGLNAFTQATRQDIVVPKGETLRLEYAVVVHESLEASGYKPQAAYERFLARE